MVVIGSDVVSMYPNLDVDSVVDIIGEEIKRTQVYLRGLARNGEIFGT